MTAEFSKPIDHARPPSNLETIINLYRHNPFVHHTEKLALTAEHVSLIAEGSEAGLYPFERYLFDAGLNQQWNIDPGALEDIHQVDGYVPAAKPAVAIFNRNTLIRTATNRLLDNKYGAFINLDLGGLRAADRIKYADYLLRDFATIISKIAAKYASQGIDINVGRTGGDEFSFFAASDMPIDRELLKQIYAETEEACRLTPGFYLNDNGEIEKRPMVLKVEDENIRFVVANTREDRDKILTRFLQAGQIPDALEMEKEKLVEGERVMLEYDESKAMRLVPKNPEIQRRRRLDRNRFFNDHPEFAEEAEIIRRFSRENKPYTSELLYNLLRSYTDDKILGREISQLPDLITRVSYDKQKTWRMVVLSFPWTKNLNHEYGITRTNGLIRAIYGRVTDYLKEHGIPESAGWARRGGDYIIDVPEGVSLESIILNPVLEMKVPPGGLLTGSVFEKTEGLPLFISTTMYNLDTSPAVASTRLTTVRPMIDNIVRNLESINRMAFYDWLNNVFKKDPQTGKEVVAFYLSQRTEDRRAEMSYWLKHWESESDLSQDFKAAVGSVS